MTVFENVDFEDVSFVAEPITSPKRRNPFYLVWRNSYNMEDNFVSISYFGGLDGYGTVMGVSAFRGHFQTILSGESFSPPPTRSLCRRN